MAPSIANNHPRASFLTARGPRMQPAQVLVASGSRATPGSSLRHTGGRRGHLIGSAHPARMTNLRAHQAQAPHHSDAARLRESRSHRHMGCRHEQDPPFERYGCAFDRLPTASNPWYAWYARAYLPRECWQPTAQSLTTPLATALPRLNPQPTRRARERAAALAHDHRLVLAPAPTSASANARPIGARILAAPR